MNYKFAVLALSFIVLMFSIPAFAQEAVSGNIAVLDLELVVQKSDAGKGVQAEIKKREDSMMTAAKAFRKTLKEKEQKLIADRKAGQDDAAFGKAKNDFEAEVKKSQQSMIEKNNALEKSKHEALKAIQEQIAKVTADIADERKLQIVVDRKFVVIAEQKLDITDEVLKRLNAALKSVPFK
ncbi:MAG: OmpH family outer membrane protein [Alphaproteobacteria bacterium]|nr:OmpH family outer membrane protein [Alphaproteobacteria bacterium]MCB1550951.1 OmpH family outer membrane protein [Alphaproteobacteria bacterium]MCB9984870.1 OmpH family outer membrane protein [Micavibrio sp.]HPQ50838.1 OmpH family outer membrane protein [Alphaproteobacteria bacterium]HRK97262.1 OmpH family outer membrane protein [Alphaproteobacteria bacterium]